MSVKMSKGKEDSLIRAMAHAKCPRCREGNMFQYPLRKVFKFSLMHKHCPHCNLRFEREPGFFFGAMFISYILSVFLFFIVTFSLYYLLDEPPNWVIILSMVVVVFLMLPLLFRYSRVIYLYGFGGVKYSPGQ